MTSPTAWAITQHPPTAHTQGKPKPSQDSEGHTSTVGKPIPSPAPLHSSSLGVDVESEGYKPTSAPTKEVRHMEMSHWLRTHPTEISKSRIQTAFQEKSPQRTCARAHTPPADASKRPAQQTPLRARTRTADGPEPRWNASHSSRLNPSPQPLKADRHHHPRRRADSRSCSSPHPRPHPSDPRSLPRPYPRSAPATRRHRRSQ